MKKLITLSLTIVLLATTFLTGCDADQEKSAHKAIFDAETVISQLEVTNLNYGNYLLVKNNSDFDVKLTYTVTTYDEEGSVIEIENRTYEAFERGTEIIAHCYMNSEFDSFDYKFEAEEVDHDQCVNSNLSYEIVEGKDNYIITVKNDGEIDANHVYGYLLLYQDGKIVEVYDTEFKNRLLSLDSGESIIEELGYSPSYYDSYKFVVFGKKSSY